jgi:hypothetical protein
VNAPLPELRPWVPPSVRRMAALILAGAAVAAVLAALGGWLAGGLAAPADEPSPAATVERQVSTLGPVRFEAPAGWVRVADAPETARLDPDRTDTYSPAPGALVRAVLTLAPLDHASLLPAGLRAALAGKPPVPTPAHMLGRDAWYYKDVPLRGDRRMDVAVVPTTAGVLAFACVGARTDDPVFDDCTIGVPQLDLRSARPLAPAPDLAIRTRLPAAIAELDRRRIPLRAALRDAGRPAGQARIAGRLAAAYGSAVTALAPVAPEGGGGVFERLQGVQVAYRRLAGAAGGGHAGAFARARRAVDARERALAEALG